MILIGLGSNLDDPPAQLADAIARIRRVMEVQAVSPIYRSAPVGYVHQPDFYNLVCQVQTSLNPHDLLERTRGIEREMGRTRGFRNAPRVIDIDILAFGDLVMDTETLTIPHPRMHERAFVLVPLGEIAPAWRHPVLGIGDAGLFLELHNEARAVAGLDELEDDGLTDDELLDLHFQERAFHLWMTNHRLADMRRLVRQHGLGTEEVFPTGGFFKGGEYGPDVNFPLPIDEENNPNFEECIDREA